MDEVVGRRLTPTVYTEAGLDGLSQVARDLGVAARVHLKVDTGMHRVGLYPPEKTVSFARRILDSGLELEGLWTHFARSEEDEETTHDQLGRFLKVSRTLEESGIDPPLRHAANSAAAALYPDSHFDLVRIGIATYGLEHMAIHYLAHSEGAAATLSPAPSATRISPSQPHQSLGCWSRST